MVTYTYDNILLYVYVNVVNFKYNILPPKPFPTIIPIHDPGGSAIFQVTIIIDTL